MLTFSTTDHNPFEERGLEKAIPTNEPQKEIWVACLLGGEAASLAYNETVSVRFKGNPDRKILIQALEHLGQRHEALRAGLSPNGETLLIQEQVGLPLEIIDLSEMSGSEKEALLADQIRTALNTPFDLYCPPLYRLYLHILDMQEVELTIVAHHILLDGWSLGVWLDELSQIYNRLLTSGSLHTLAAPGSLSAYALGQTNTKIIGAHQTSLMYWKQRLEGYPAWVPMPFDAPAPPERSFRGQRLDFVLPARLYQALTSLSKRAQTSLTFTALCAFEHLLRAELGWNRFTLGLPVAGQLELENPNLIGHCVHLLPIPSQAQADASFYAYLQRRKGELLEDLDHKNISFNEILKAFPVARNKNRIPFIPMVFNIDIGMDQGVQFSDLEHVLRSRPREFTHFDLFLNISGDAKSACCEWTFNSDVFEERTIREFHKQYVKTLEQITRDPHTTSSTTKVGASAPQAPELIRRFEEASVRYATLTAIKFNSQSISYQILNQQVNQLARQLRSQGIRPGDRVAMTTQRSIEMLISMLAIMKTGAVFVPIDALYPSERKRLIVEHIALKCLIHQGLEDLGFLGALPAYRADELLLQAGGQATDNLSLDLDEHREIYVLHTSGSTGVPKGVCMNQPALANIFDWQVRNSGLREGHCTLQFSPLNFDVSFQEIFSTFFTGGNLVLISEADRLDSSRLLSYLESQGIHRLFLPFVALQGLAEIAESHERFPKPLLEVITAGEQLKITPQIIRFFQALPDCLLFNHYGPTETHIVTSLTLKGQPLSWPALPSIGREIDHTRIYILSPESKPVPEGSVGELCISGVCLADGYENQPEQTRDRFIDWEDSEGHPIRVYKSGDLGQRLPDGNIQFMGRLDDQIKIRGFRVELSEIEFHLNQLGAVRQSVVLAHHDRQLHNTRLIGYVTLQSGKLYSKNSASLLDWKERWEHLYENADQAQVENQNLDALVVQQLDASRDLQDHAREWLEETLNRIRETISSRFKDQPLRILEIGCGGGQLIEELISHCAHYYASDYSEVVISNLKKQYSSGKNDFTKITLSASEANDLDFLDGQQVDLVIINSVVQYFPDETYLIEVLQQAVDHLSPKGCVFLGDVQDRATLPMCLMNEHLPHVKSDLSVERFRESVRQRIRTEDELVLDPAFFYRLPYTNPNIYHAETQLKKGDHLNETTKYHYDVWLYKDPGILLVEPQYTLPWEQAENIVSVKRRLQRHPGQILRVSQVPNHRIAYDKVLMKLIESLPPDTSIHSLKQQAAQGPRSGEDPQAFWALGQEMAFDTLVRPALDSTEMDIVFIPKAINVKTTLPPDLFQVQPRASYLQLIDTDHTRDLQREWKQRLGEKLPEYMVPDRIVCLSNMPVSSTGKIDRKALFQLNLERRSQAGTEQERPQETVPIHADVELFLEQLWGRILNLKDIGPEEDFFELGGHSLLAIKVMVAIEKTYKVRLPLATLFDHANIRDLATKIREVQGSKESPDQEEQPWNALVPIKRTGTKPPLYLVHGAGLNIIIFKLLSKFMDPDQPVFGLQALGQNGQKQSFGSIADIAEKYVQDLLRNDPVGPYFIGGYSYGGFLAYEMVRSLKKQGKEVRMLAIFDTYVDEFDRAEITLSGLWKRLCFTVKTFLKHPFRFLRYRWMLLRIKFTLWFSRKPHIDRIEAFVYEHNIIDQYKDAFKAYKIQPQEVDICLFRAKNTLQYYEEPQYMGWKNFSKHTYVYPVPGEHKTMFYPPHAEALAKILTQAIRAHS